MHVSFPSLGVRALATCLLAAIDATGQIPLRGYARVDEKVLDTETSIERLPTPIPFRSFRYPHVNVTYDATFIADDNNYYVQFQGETKLLGTMSGIYRSLSRSGEIVPLAVEGGATPISTNSAFLSFSGLQTHEKSYCFMGAAKSTTGPEVFVGLFASFFGGPLKCILYTGQTIPGVTDRGTNPDYCSIYLDDALYTVNDIGNRAFIVLYDSLADTHKAVLKSGDKVPTSAGVDAACVSFARNNWIHDLDVTAHAHRDDNGSGLYLIDVTDFKKEGARGITLIADTGMHPPDSPASRFTRFYSAPVDHQRVAFVADAQVPGETHHTNQGVYIWANDELVTVADLRDTIPGHDMPFAGFNPWVAMDKGKLIFRGFGPNGYEGLFLFDPDLDALFLLIDNVQQLEGKQIASFEIGSNCIVGGRMIFLARFADDSMAVYMALTPALLTPRLDIPLSAR